MSLIYDRFPAFENAAKFARVVARDFALDVSVFTDADEARQVDPFPFELEPPVVLVSRSDEATERKVTNLVAAYHGHWAGT